MNPFGVCFAGPFKAEYGCHVAEEAGPHEGDLFWHVHDAENRAIAFFYCEEDAQAFAEASNRVAVVELVMQDRVKPT